jgi:pyruvate/2-oxoglutarate dehydrogenase complex dihydrolipoamide acyltransferase (E2) component
MSIGAMRKVVVPGVAGNVKVSTLAQVGITFDHRVIDGEAGCRFLAFIKDYLESLKV